MKNAHLRFALRFGALFVTGTLLAGCASMQSFDAASRREKIRHVVVIYAENHSFDNLYGLFPGANGIANASMTERTQLDHDGTPLAALTVWNSAGKPDPKFPKMPNGPFLIAAS